jgi:4-amino-4-deoxy-L-arabinose transferase-like glycosyltransferase
MSIMSERIRSNYRRILAAVGSNRTDLFLCSLLFASGAYVYYSGLGGYPIRTFDEGTYANVAKNMLLWGEWLVPHLNWPGTEYQPYFEKPPLFLWLEGLSMLVFGITEFGARFVSATSAVLVGLAVYVLGRETFDEVAGFTAGLVWLSTPYVVAGFNGGRHGGIETQLVLLGIVFVYLTRRLVDGEYDRRRYVLLGVVAGLLVLGKGVAAGAFVIVVLPYVVLGFDRIWDRNFALTVGVTALIALPWVLMMWVSYGGAFLDVFLGEQVFGRISGSTANDYGGLFGWMKFPYFGRLPGFHDPWTHFAPAAAFVLAYLAYVNGEHERLRDVLLLVWWGGSVFLFFVFTGNHGWYVMPVYPASALLTGGLVSAALTGDRLPAVGVVFATGSASLFSPRSVVDLLPGMVRSDVLVSEVTTGLPYVAGLVVVLGLVLTVRGLGSGGVGPSGIDARVRVAGPLLACLIVVTAFVGVPPPALNQGQEWTAQRALGEDIRSRTAPDEVTYFQPEIPETANELMTASFYSHRRHAEASVERISSERSIRHAVVLSDDLVAVDRRYSVVGEYHVRGENVTFLAFPAGEADSDGVAGRAADGRRAGVPTRGLTRATA